MEWIRNFIDAILMAIAWAWDQQWKLVQFLFDRVEKLWQWFRDIVIQLFEEIWGWFAGKLDEHGVMEALDAEMNAGLDGDGRGWSYWAEYLVDVSWIFPLAEVVSILSFAFSVCVAIRLLRWVKSFVPTVSGA